MIMNESRRGFAKQLTMACAGVGAFFTKVERADAAVTDSDILQFALNLEYLEAEFYTIGLTGQTIQQMGSTVSGSGNSGFTTGGQQVTFFNNSSLYNSLMQIGADGRTRACRSDPGRANVARDHTHIKACHQSQRPEFRLPEPAGLHCAGPSL